MKKENNKNFNEKQDKEYGPTFSIIVVIIIISILGIYGFNFLREDIRKNTELREQVERERQANVDKILQPSSKDIRILGEFESGLLSDQDVDEIINSIIEQDKQLQKELEDI